MLLLYPLCCCFIPCAVALSLVLQLYPLCCSFLPCAVALSLVLLLYPLYCCFIPCATALTWCDVECRLLGVLLAATLHQHQWICTFVLFVGASSLGWKCLDECQRHPLISVCLQEGRTALWFAAHDGRAHLASHLLSAPGIDVNLGDMVRVTLVLGLIGGLMLCSVSDQGHVRKLSCVAIRV
jgi:hypothetical protein